MIKFILEISLLKKHIELNQIYLVKPSFFFTHNTKNIELHVWGDPIKGKDFDKGIYNNPTPEFILNNLYGHYYYLLWDITNENIIIGNSLFSILPLYYYETGDKLIVSENALSLGKHYGLKVLSRRFILETFLFNYPIFNSSIIEGIHLLPSNSYIIISGHKWSIEKHTRVEFFFPHTPKPWSKSVDEISNHFLDTVKKYLPDKPYINALTGGFDGRTLVSAGLFHKKQFSCYSFGSSESKDTKIAARLAANAGIQFYKIFLDNNYAENHSLNCGIEFIRNSSGTATFTRAHYLYASKLLALQTEHIITGNFGSEIFRAVHNPGVVFSNNLLNIFNSSGPIEAFIKIQNSVGFNYLNKDGYNLELESLKEDLLLLPCFNRDYSNLSRNQQFYVFVFEEVFRKYFGAEMINQFYHLKNRTPFLDIDFMKAIFETGLAGIHSGFLENNPLKRYKGQILYAHLINKAYPEFGKIMTDKGYRPDDLLTLSGKLNIIIGYLSKITRKDVPDFDPYGVSKAWKNNQDFWSKVPNSPDFFNLTELKKNDSSLNREFLSKIISLSYLVSENLLSPGIKEISHYKEN